MSRRKPTLEDVLELSGIELLHPGGLDITKRIGEIVEMKGKKALDVACGRGTLPSYYARTFGARIVGVDISPEMIKSSVERARREEVEDLTEFQVADSLKLPFEDSSFDVVVSECAVGLTSDPRKCLAEMARVTRPGGFVVIHESTWLRELPEAEKLEVARRFGTVPYALAEWKEMMENAGLVQLWTEDWSGPENAFKIRPGRKVNNLSDVFSRWEMVSIILPRLIRRYGATAILSVNKSARKIVPLYFDGTLGYFLIRGQKP